MSRNMKRLLKSEHPALQEIGESRNWIKVKLVSKEWSTDLKYAEPAVPVAPRLGISRYEQYC